MSNYCTVSADNLRAGGALISGATISFTPRIVNGTDADFNLAGVEQHSRYAFTTAVVNGAFSINLPKSSLTSPLNIAYIVEVVDNITGETLLGGPLSGYANFQTGSANGLDFDAYQPITPPNPTILNELLAKGDKGNKGDPGSLENNVGDVNVSAGTLGHSIGDELDLIQLKNFNDNGNKLRIYQWRYANGSGWDTAETKVESVTDGSVQGYVAFNSDGFRGGVELGANGVPGFGLSAAGDAYLPKLAPASAPENLMIDAGNGAIFTRAPWAAVPATSTSTGTAGQRAYDSSYFYICVATNTWKRVALSTW